MRVTAYPATVNAGQQTTLVVQALPVDAFGISGMTIREGGKVVTYGNPVLSSDGVTASWRTPPLTAGTHSYDIEYIDFYARHSHTTIDVAVSPSKHRAAHH